MNDPDTPSVGRSDGRIGRRGVLRGAGVALSTSLAGCSTLTENEPVDVAVHNADAAPHVVEVLVEEAAGERTYVDAVREIAADAWATFPDAIPDPTARDGVESIHVRVTVRDGPTLERTIDLTPSAGTFSGGRRLAILQIRVTGSDVRIRRVKE